MSRFCGDKNSRPILEAAAHWRDVALLGGGSVFTDQSLWTLDGPRSARGKAASRRNDLGDKPVPEQYGGRPQAIRR